MRSLTEIRRALEPTAAALAAQRRTSADIARLRLYLSEMEGAGHAGRSITETELAFHLAVGIASGNPLMRSVASVIEVALASAVSYGASLDDTANRNGAVRTYTLIVNAIESRNAPAAAKAMLKVIDIGARNIEATRKTRRVKRRTTIAVCGGRIREEISC
jgi:DNA-binding FadR family transcriptional regulator